MEKWQGYVSALFEDDNRSQILRTRCVPPIDEIGKTIQLAKNGKAQTFIKTHTKLLNMIYNTSKTPVIWLKSNFVLILKKNKATKCDHRTISLIFKFLRVIQNPEFTIYIHVMHYLALKSYYKNVEMLTMYNVYMCRIDLEKASERFKRQNASDFRNY